MLQSRWNPGQVYNPDFKRKRVFCGLEEWIFILKLLKDRVSVEVIRLDIPADAEGWVMKVDSRHDPRPIYIKLQLDADGFVIGRSFHYRDPR